MEAEEDYQAAIAKTDEESNALLGQHMDERVKIENQLAILVPETFQEVMSLLKFATDLGEDGHLTNGADVMDAEEWPTKACKSVLCNKGDIERKAAAVEMRDGPRRYARRFSQATPLADIARCAEAQRGDIVVRRNHEQKS